MNDTRATKSYVKIERIIVDLAMAVLMPFLMAYSLIGEEFHEIAGIVMFFLFLLHHYLNRGWWKSLFKGKYSPARIFQLVIDLLLLFYMILQPLSGILMSSYLFKFTRGVGFTAQARLIHLALAFWGLIFMSLHIGTNLTRPIKKLMKKGDLIKIGLIVIVISISLYGLYIFISRGYLNYMLLRQHFLFLDSGEPKILYLLNILSVMVLFESLGYLLKRVFRKLKG